MEYLRVRVRVRVKVKVKVANRAIRKEALRAAGADRIMHTVCRITWSCSDMAANGVVDCTLAR